MYYVRCLHMDLPEDQSAFLWGARKTGKSTIGEVEKGKKWTLFFKINQ